MKLNVSAGYCAVAVIPVAVTFLIFALSPPHAVNDYFSDDAYYYFRVAENIAHGNGSTYGNLVLTNGYHPLWQFLLVPFFFLIEDPTKF